MPAFWQLDPGAGSYALRLPRIFGYIIKFFLINQPPTLTHNGRLSPFDWIFDLVENRLSAYGQASWFYLPLAKPNGWKRRRTYNLLVSYPRQIKKSRGNVHRMTRVSTFFNLSMPPSGQCKKNGTRCPPSYYSPSVPHSRIENLSTAGRPVVRGENKDGVVVDSQVLE